MFAGEIVFSLPFHVARYFRPTFLEVFGLSNAGLGDIFAVYGLTAMLAYFPGGALADRFSTRKLLTVSLLATAAGGLYLAQIPGRGGMSGLFAYWGITSILLFWAAMIRATREWGGRLAQGRAFGILDGGRGLVAAAVASVAVLLLSRALPDAAENISPAARRQALQGVIYFYVLMTAAGGGLVWLLIPDSDATGPVSRSLLRQRIGTVLTQRTVWLQAVIVVCAYCGYKGLDNYALYATEVIGMNEVAAAGFTATAAYLRPVAAIAAGFLADRLLASRTIVLWFLLLVVSYGLLALLSPGAATMAIYANLLVTFGAVFALRGVYFALLEETRVQRHATGVAVGLISVIGFTPDIFFAPLAGRLLDASPGLPGHQHFFALLTAMALLGLSAVLWLHRLSPAHSAR